MVIVSACIVDWCWRKLEQVFQSYGVSQMTLLAVADHHTRIQQGQLGGQQLVLEKGTQYEGSTVANDYQIVQFDEYAVTIEEPDSQAQRKKMVAIPTLELWDMDSIEAKAEMQWRIAIPLSLPFLVLIAVPLSAVDPRQGRFGKMFPALLLYLGYFLLLLASRRVMEDGKLPSFIGLWWVHIVMLIVGTGLLARDRKTGAFIRRLFVKSDEPKRGEHV